MAQTDDNQDFDDFDTVAADDLPDATVDDATDDDGDAYSQAAARRKRQLTFYAVLVFMIALGAVSAWFVFFDNGTTSGTTDMRPVAATPPAQQATDTATAPADASVLPPGVITPQDMANATAAVPSAVTAPSVDAAPTPPASLTPVDGTTVEALPPPIPAETVDTAPAMPEAAPQAITPVTPDAPAMMPLAGETPMAAMPSAPIPPAATAPVATPIAAPVTATDNAASEQRLSQMEQQIQQLTAELAAAKAGLSAANTGNTADSGLAAQLNAVNAKLDRVTKQVEDLDQRTTSFAAELQNRANQPAEPAKAAAPKAAATARKPKTLAKAAAVVSPNWELRSATPGVAWLGKLGSDEMARYNVGQTVPGLGVVQDVTQEGNRWVVKTTGGTLRQ